MRHSLADEDANYNRRDFTPSTGTAASASAPAFLVRMRRTNDANGLDQQPASVPAGRRCRFCSAAAA